MNETTTIGLDIAKQVFQVHGVAVDSTVTVKRQLRRSEVIRFFDRLPEQYQNDPDAKFLEQEARVKAATIVQLKYQ